MQAYALFDAYDGEKILEGGCASKDLLGIESTLWNISMGLLDGGFDTSWNTVLCLYGWCC